MSGGEWQTKFSVSPGPGLWPLVLGPFGPDLGPDLDLDLSLTIDWNTLYLAKLKRCLESFKKSQHHDISTV